MASHKEMKNLAKENKLLLMELPYYNCKDLKNAHPQYNALLDTNLASRKSIHSFNSLYDLGLFQNDSVDKTINVRATIHLIAFPWSLKIPEIGMSYPISLFFTLI